MKYSAPLDGLRGLAIIFVILFHFGFFAAGWIGVQVFFVLSGYLITSILLADKMRRPAAEYFARFYWRRSLRIFTLYFGYLMLLAVVYLIVSAPKEFAERWLYLLTYTYNYALLIAPLRESVAFTHFWSLAVEEQFYLIWPIVVLVLSRTALKTVVAVVLIITPMIRYAAVLTAHIVAPEHVQPGLYAYSPLPAQWDALATGAGVALLGVDRVTRPVRWLVIGTLVTLSIGVANLLAGGQQAFGDTSLGYPPFAIERYQHVWSYTVVNVWSALLLIAVSAGGGVSAFFEQLWLTYSGRISYGLYVLHYPILGLIKQAVYFEPYSLEGAVVFLCYLVVLYGVASMSFHYFEAWFLAYKDALPAGQRPAGSEARAG